jgi:CPA1 family monovalent cation:H+ antiporter
MLNGLVFMLIGLDLPEIISGLREEGSNFYEATLYGLLVTLVLIVGRMIAAFAALIVTKIASHFITVADNNPGLKAPLIIGWTGMRGVVSLAAALSIPVLLADGTPFPQRNLVLYITFVVIFVTLVLQGLTLPVVIRKIKLPSYNDHIPEEETEILIRGELARTSLAYLTRHHKTELAHSPTLKTLAGKWQAHIHGDEEAGIPEGTKTIYLRILEEQRQLLLEKNRKEQRIDEEIIRKFLHLVDLEEEKLRSN